VRAAGIQPQPGTEASASNAGTAAPSSATPPGATSQQGEYYLLSKVEGFTFKNRLVHKGAIGAEFETVN
jgi:hypothetical protein